MNPAALGRILICAALLILGGGWQRGVLQGGFVRLHMIDAAPAPTY